MALKWSPYDISLMIYLRENLTWNMRSVSTLVNDIIKGLPLNAMFSYLLKNNVSQ